MMKVMDKDENADIESDGLHGKRSFPVAMNSAGAAGGSLNNRSEWKRKSIVISALTVLTSSQAILIVWSKRAGKYDYSVTTANFLVETLKCALSLLALTRIWRTEGVTEDNRMLLDGRFCGLTSVDNANLASLYDKATSTSTSEKILYGIPPTSRIHSFYFQFCSRKSKSTVTAPHWSFILMLTHMIWMVFAPQLSTSLDEVNVYPIPAALYLVKNLLQYYIFAYVDAPGYQILKNLNIISTGVLYKIILKRQLSSIQWAAFVLLCAGCTTAQLNPASDHVLQTPFQGWIMAIVMALLSGFAGVYTEAIIKKRPSRNINVQNFWLYVFGMIFNAVAIVIQDFDAVVNEGFFHGYSFITVVMIFNHALSGIAVSMVMKYADNIVKVYSTSVAMVLTAFVSYFFFGFHLSLAFFLGSVVVSVSVYLHAVGKPQR